MEANGKGFARFFGFVTLGLCALAVFDPRFRRACLGLLCRFSDLI